MHFHCFRNKADLQSKDILFIMRWRRASRSTQTGHQSRMRFAFVLFKTT
jgi:hypothetical protein